MVKIAVSRESRFVSLLSSIFCITVQVCRVAGGITANVPPLHEAAAFGTEFFPLGKNEVKQKQVQFTQN